MGNVPIARLLGVIAAWLTSKLVAMGYGGVDEGTLVTLMLVVYSAVHSLFRSFKKKKLVVEP